MAKKTTNKIFFTHIPKTAGTSFRKGLEEYFGGEAICYDYGVSSPETTALITDDIYGKKDFWSFFSQLDGSLFSCVAGHVALLKYVDGIGVRNSITFLRNPVQRILSEYKHFVRINGYEDSFESFYRQPAFVNRQKKLISGVPLESIGFVGVTERYSECLEVINKTKGFSVPNLQLNKNRSELSDLHAITEQQKLEIENLNREDMLLYEQVCKLLNERISYSKKNCDFIHGQIQQISCKGVWGWAWSARNDDPVEVTVRCNNRIIGVTRARDLRPGMLRFSPPRGGYVGFRQDYDASLGDVISCEIAATGQCIGIKKVIRT